MPPTTTSGRPSRARFGDPPGGAARPRRRRIARRRVGHVDAAMRDARPLGRRGLGGADVEAAVHLARVGAHDDGTGAGGEVEQPTRSSRPRSDRR